MLSEVVFHGAPQGFDFWGKSDGGYYESFYSSIDYKGVKTALIVEIRKDTIGFCSYYTYVRPRNVVAKNGRSGSYFGMSLKIQGQYCTDVYSLYQLFDKIYEEKILGTILTRIGDAENYLVASFSDAKSSLKVIAQLADNLVKSNFASDFEDIDKSFTKQYASTSVYCNLDDVNSEAFFNTTKVYGKVFVSPEYSSKDAIISTLSSLDKKYQALKTDYEKQSVDLQKENSQIARLESSLKMAQQELKRASNVGRVADKLEPSLNELLEIMRSVRTIPENPFPQQPISAENNIHVRREKFLRIIIVILLVALMVCLCKPRKQPSTDDIAASKTDDSLRTKNSELCKMLSSLKEKRNTQLILTQSEKYPEAKFQIFDDSDSTLVDGALQCGKKYKVKCEGINVRQSEWKSDGAIIKHKKNQNPTYLEVENNSNMVVLSFYVKCDNKEDKALSIVYLVKPTT